MPEEAVTEKKKWLWQSIVLALIFCGVLGYIWKRYYIPSSPQVTFNQEQEMPVVNFYQNKGFGKYMLDKKSKLKNKHHLLWIVSEYPGVVVPEGGSKTEGAEFSGHRKLRCVELLDFTVQEEKALAAKGYIIVKSDQGWYQVPFVFRYDLNGKDGEWFINITRENNVHNPPKFFRVIETTKK